MLVYMYRTSYIMLSLLSVTVFLRFIKNLCCQRTYIQHRALLNQEQTTMFSKQCFYCVSGVITLISTESATIYIYRDTQIEIIQGGVDCERHYANSFSTTLHSSPTR